jgi:hypothetical protein
MFREVACKVLLIMRFQASQRNSSLPEQVASKSRFGNRGQNAFSDIAIHRPAQRKAFGRLIERIPRRQLFAAFRVG